MKRIPETSTPAPVAIKRLRRRPSARARLSALRARAELAEARLKAVMDAIPEGVVLLDAEGRYSLWNTRYAEIYHRSADLFAPGKRFMDVLRVGVARGDYPEATGREAVWLAERERKLLEARARHEQQIADGRWLMIEDRPSPDGGIVGLRIDITEMKEQALVLERAVAEAQAANKAKSEFLANVSHEIRTPLHGVLGMAQVLARDPELSDDQRTRVAVIRRSGEALLELLNDLLDLAKIEAGKLAIKAEPMRAAEVVEAACAPFESLAAEKGLDFHIDPSPIREARWVGDALRMQQVLSNLVSNAIKFTTRGGVSVTAELANGEAAFHVRDTGIGIPTARLDEIFEKFAQLESASDRRFGGTGLGLAVSRQLAELMGGTLAAESRPGEGSVFTLRLPVIPANSEDGGLLQPPPALVSTPAFLRVLAAEDNETNQAILRALLAPVGVELTLVGNGREALEAFQAGGFDVVLMDIQMPLVDGVSAAREIRALEADEARARTPIIALSANVMEHQAVEYRLAGMDAVVGKPFDAQELISAIARILERDEAAAVGSKRRGARA